MPWEHYAAVPDIDGASLVVVDGRLPRVDGDLYRLPEVLAALEPLIGSPAYLRVGGHVDGPDDRILRLHEFAAAPGRELVPFADADPERLAPPELRPALARWLAEQRGAAVPALRPAWARPGWHERAERWTGCPLRPHRMWPLSAVLEGDGVFLKAVFAGFHHEPAVTRALAREHPGSVPHVLKIEEREGWLLMRALEGRPGWAQESPGPALRALDEIQQAWRGRREELRALGAPDRTLPVLERSLESLVASSAPEHAGAVPLLAEACRELAARGEPETIVHDDFHADNVVVDAAGRATIFDWSDACIAHASFDRLLYLFDEAQPGGDDVVAAAPTFLHQAVSYVGILAGFEPDDQWWFAGEPRRWIERAVALVS